MGTHKRTTPVINTDIHQRVAQDRPDTNRTFMDTNKRASPATNAYTSQGATQLNTQKDKSQTHYVVR